MPLSQEDRSDLDSLFGEDESHDECETNQQETPPRSVISFPRAVSQNVGTIAHSPVPSSSEHPHSSGPVSSASIPLMRNSLEARSGSGAQGKRNASPEPHQPNKKRRVELGDPVSGGQPQVEKQAVDSFGLPASTEHALTAEVLRVAINLLDPRANSFQNRSRASKGNRKPAPSKAPAISGSGSATDPVVISEAPPVPGARSASRTSAQIASASHVTQPTQSSTARRLTRSQEAHALLEALPSDPTDVLSQTLRTILKTPTTIPHSRNSAPRDIAVYLANGRHTGTPFLRLLRYLAGPTRRTDTKIGLGLLKKLVEAMRAMEEASAKTARASQSSAASTPMPITPSTPSVASFPAPEGSAAFHSLEQTCEPTLFAQPELAFEPPSRLSFPPFGDPNEQRLADIAIDPELLAISQDPSYLQAMPGDLHNFDINLEELLGALPAPSPDCLASAPNPNSALDATQALDVAGFPSWDELSNLPLGTFLDTWLPLTSTEPASTVPFPRSTSVGPQSAVPLPGTVSNAQSTSKRVQPDLPPGGIRIPPRAEALALLGRARARKKELEAKIASARRLAWGCMVEAGVERNLLGKLRGANDMEM